MEKTGQCAKEELSSSLLGKLALPFFVTNMTGGGSNARSGGRELTLLCGFITSIYTVTE